MIGVKEMAARIIKNYEEMIKIQNEKVVNIVGGQSQLLKKFKDNEILFKTQRTSANQIKMTL